MGHGWEDDLALVRGMLRGEEPAFERFFEAAYPALYRFALPRLGFDRDAAADVAQATLCQALRKLSTYRGEATLLAWLYTFCRHELYAWMKLNGRLQVELAEDDPEVRAALESLRSSRDVEAEVDRARVASFVQRVLDHLPPHYANALEWKYIDDLPVREIAIRLGIGGKAAESLLSRARRAFRDAMSGIANAPAMRDASGSRS